MSRSNHTEAQMIGALKQLETGRTAEDVAREVGVSKHGSFSGRDLGAFISAVLPKLWCQGNRMNLVRSSTG